MNERYVYVNVYQEDVGEEPIVVVFDNRVAAQGHEDWVLDNDYVLLSADKVPVYVMFARETKNGLQCFYAEEKDIENELANRQRRNKEMAELAKMA